MSYTLGGIVPSFSSIIAKAAAKSPEAADWLMKAGSTDPTILAAQNKFASSLLSAGESAARAAAAGAAAQGAAFAQKAAESAITGASTAASEFIAPTGGSQSSLPMYATSPTTTETVKKNNNLVYIAGGVLILGALFLARR